MRGGAELWLSVIAERWLEEHKREVALVDTDNNLGDALISRAWLKELTNTELDRGFARLGESAFQQLRCNTMDALTQIVATGEASGFIADRQARDYPCR